MKTKNYSTVRLRRLPISFQIEKRAIIVFIVLSLVLVGLSLLSLSTGTYKISIGRVIRTLMGEGNRIEEFTVLTLRLPRILMGILVGIGLSTSGAILQGLTRNP